MINPAMIPEANTDELPQKATILVIDDERTLRQTVRAVLHFAGYEVLDAPDGLTGIKVAEEAQPDLIISDVLMPGMNGFDLLKTLRQNPATAAIPVVLVTALSEHDSMRQGMTLGADDYLMKPFRPEDLLEAVKVRLERQAVLAEKHDTTLKILRKNIIYALPHEMRTPLHLILGFAQMLEMHHERASIAEVLQAASAIVQAGKRLERLVENYLVYAQTEVLANDPEEAAALRNHLTRDTERVITAAASQQAEVLNRLGDLTLDVSATPLRVAEETLIKIVTELVDNAAKFSEPGTPIRVVSVLTDSAYILRVCDSGRGMTAEQIRRVGAYMQFERAFYEQQGLGLGLAIVRRLAELHGGSMDICSIPNKSTEIIIHLPR